jgi:hypothetical protein
MCIDKKLLINFIVFMTFSLSLMAQSSTRDLPAFDNQEVTDNNHVEVYPNPTSDFLHVQIKESQLNDVDFEMYNIIGTNIRVTYEQVGKRLYKIPVKDLANGYYMLIVKDEGLRYRKAFKFMKI